jgi:hypothetical protein
VNIPSLVIAFLRHHSIITVKKYFAAVNAQGCFYQQKKFSDQGSVLDAGL